jgi:hypothetical protein
MKRMLTGAGLCVVATCGSAMAQSKDDIIKALHEHTRIGICADADPENFTRVEVGNGMPYKPLFGPQVTDTVYPVKAEYTVHCTQGNRNMRYGEVTEWQVEVRGLFELYRDPFGDLQVADTFEDRAQQWNDAQTDVHCRAKRLAYLTYDPTTGNIVKRREDNTPGYGFCAVRMRAER